MVDGGERILPDTKSAISKHDSITVVVPELTTLEEEGSAVLDKARSIL